MSGWRVDGTGRGRRVRRRRYVDVLARLGRDGVLDPVCVLWPDGRAFHVDEVLERGALGRPAHGRRQARYRVRFGGHETELWLEAREGVPAVGESPTLRWWVWGQADDEGDHAPGRDGMPADAAAPSRRVTEYYD